MNRVKLADTSSSKFVELAREKIHKHTCQILEKGGAYGYKPMGSGVLATINNRPYILTAAHVTEEIGITKNIYINANGKIIPINGDLRQTELQTDKNVDVAYILLDPKTASLISNSYNFLSDQKILSNHQPHDTTQYLTLGYPEINIKAENGVIRTGSTFFLHSLVKSKIYEFYNFNPDLHYIVDFAGKGTSMFSNVKAKINTEPYGMSGCGLWYISAYGTETEFYLDYDLIGIMTEFKKSKYLVLIGCKIDLILNDLKGE